MENMLLTSAQLEVRQLVRRPSFAFAECKSLWMLAVHAVLLHFCCILVGWSDFFSTCFCFGTSEIYPTVIHSVFLFNVKSFRVAWMNISNSVLSLVAVDWTFFHSNSASQNNLRPRWWFRNPALKATLSGCIQALLKSGIVTSQASVVSWISTSASTVSVCHWGEKIRSAGHWGAEIVIETGWRRT